MIVPDGNKFTIYLFDYFMVVFPFCYMDANSYYEQHFSHEQALAEMKHYHEIIKQVNGEFITIWHNHFLGTDKMFEGWKEVYEMLCLSV